MPREPLRDSGGEERSRVPAIQRAGAVFDALMESQGEPMSLTDLARQLRVPKSSMLNLCNALVEERLLRRIDGVYSLGPKLAGLGAVYLASIELVREFQEVCGEHAEIEGTIKLATLGDHSDIIYLSRHDSIRPSRLVLDVRVQQPAYCTASGKAMLACLDEGNLDAWIAGRTELAQLTPHGISDVKLLRKALTEVRQSGYSIDDEECIEGVFCVGTALASRRDQSNTLGLSVALLKQHANEKRVVKLAVAIQGLAADLAERLGDGYLTLERLGIEEAAPTRSSRPG
jgi:DNA-binding IclR family transcriptional regulator